jgi:Recombinase
MTGLFIATSDPFAHLGRLRTRAWLEEHHVVWDESTGILPSVILGVYRRMSTLGQATGYRQQSMIDDMTGIVLAKGPAFGVIVFDEGNRSGQVLANRKVALAMIKALEHGDIDGIATPDAKRLSRDQYLGGGREIVLAVRQRKAMLMLGRGDIVNLRNYRERKQFERELRDASDEVGEIRQTMYSGWAARARWVAEGKVEPMWKGPAPFGYRHVDCLDQYGEVIRNRGVARRTLAKNSADEPGVARLIELLKSERSINTVARILNAEDVARRVHQGAYSHGFTGDRLRHLLDNPVYYGVWKAVREKESDLWDDFEEADLTRAVPHLAYWTEQQARDWLEKFTPQVSSRERVHARPFLGILECNACGSVMTSAGYHGYRCRRAAQQRQGIVRDLCADPQTVRATVAAAQLRGLFGVNIGRAAAMIVEEHQRQEAQAKADPVADELAVLESQEASLLDLAMGGAMTPQVKKRFDWLRERRAHLLEQQARQQTVVRLSESQVAQISALSSAPLEIYDALSANEQAEIWRLLKVKVRITHVGGRGGSARYTSEIVGESDMATGIWIVQSYLTRSA